MACAFGRDKIKKPAAKATESLPGKPGRFAHVKSSLDTGKSASKRRRPPPTEKEILQRRLEEFDRMSLRELYRLMVHAKAGASKDAPPASSFEAARNGIVLVDCRPEEEFSQCRLMDAVNLPASKIRGDRVPAALYKKLRGSAAAGTPLVVLYDANEEEAPYCTTALLYRGFETTVMLSGGLHRVLRRASVLIDGHVPPELRLAASEDSSTVASTTGPGSPARGGAARTRAALAGGAGRGRGTRGRGRPGGGGRTGPGAAVSPRSGLRAERGFAPRSRGGMPGR